MIFVFESMLYFQLQLRRTVSINFSIVASPVLLSSCISYSITYIYIMNETVNLQNFANFTFHGK